MHPFRVSPGESLPVEDNSVTLIQAATALHWFDHEKFYRECDRVLVPGGVIAAVNYTLDIKVIKHPTSNDLHQIFSEVWKDCNRMTYERQFLQKLKMQSNILIYE